MHVAGCAFYARPYRRGVRIDETQFRMVDVEKAALWILGELPKKMEKAKKWKERLANNRRCDSATETLPSCLTVEYTDWKGEGFTLTYKHVDEGAVMMAADYLQEGGFCEDAPPRENEAEFMMTQLRRIWDKITAEDKAEFLSHQYIVEPD